MHRRLLVVLVPLAVLLVAALGVPLSVTVAEREMQETYVDRLNDVGRFASLADTALSTGRTEALQQELARYHELYGIPAAAAARTLRPGGRLVNLGGSAGETSPLDSSTLRGRSLRILGYTNNELTGEQRAAAMGHVASLALEGRLHVAHERIPLTDAPTAWHRQSTGTTSGRLVLTP